MIDIAYAMAPPAGEGVGGGLGGVLIPFMLMFLVLYLLMIRPQQRKAKAHQNMLDNLKKGEDVVTSGGIHGKITGLADTVITLEVADRVRLKVSRSHISELKRPLGQQKET